LNQGASMDAAEKALNAELTRLMTEPVSDQELEKAKNKMRSEYAFARQSVQDKAQALAHAAVIHGDTSTVNREYDLFMKVTKEDADGDSECRDDRPDRPQPRSIGEHGEQEHLGAGPDGQR